MRFLKQLLLVTEREVMDRKRRHEEVVTTVRSGQGFPSIIHGPKLEAARPFGEAPARGPEHLHREGDERHPRPGELFRHHRAQEPRLGSEVEHPDLLFRLERYALEHGPIKAVEAWHELPACPVVISLLLPEQCPDGHADLLATMLSRT